MATTTTNSGNNMPNNHNVEIRESISGSLSVITLTVVLISYAFYHIDKHVKQIGLLIYILIIASAFCFLAFKIYTLARRKVIMSIGNEGVYHEKFKLMKWDDILSIKKIKEKGSDSTIVFFLFQTNHSPNPYKIPITDLDISERDLVKLIRKFRNYNIFEIVHDEW